MKHFNQCVAASMLLLPALAWADVICLTSGQEIKSKVVTIGEKEITYKKAENPNGPNYVVANESVFYIEFDDGHREVITPQDRQQPTAAATPSSSQSLTSLADIAAGQTSSIAETAEKPARFPEFGFMPRVTIGYQSTVSEIKNVNYDWGGLYADVTAMLMMSTGKTTAWSAGLSFTWMQGDVKVYSGKKPGKGDWPGMNATYIGIPVWYWWKSEYLMLGTGFNLDFLIHNTMNGEKVKDALNVFRVPWKLYGGLSVGIFDVGLHLGFDFTNAFKGKDMGWSPTVSVGGTVGIRLGKIK